MLLACASAGILERVPATFGSGASISSSRPLIFDGPTLERDDTRRNYGERRIISLGLAQMVALTVVFTDRAEIGGFARRIISARQSNRHERDAYLQALEQD